MSDGTGLAEALLGLDGFRVLKVSEAEVVIDIENYTSAQMTYGLRGLSSRGSPAGCPARALTC